MTIVKINEYLAMLSKEPNKKPAYYAGKLGVKVQSIYDYNSNHKDQVIAAKQREVTSMETEKTELEQLRENVVKLQNELNEALKRENSLKNDIKDVNDKYNAKSVLCEQYKAKLAKLDERNAQVADNRKDPELQAKYEDALKRISDYQDAIDELTANDEKLKYTFDKFKAEYDWLRGEYEVLGDKAKRYDELMDKFAAAYMKEHFGIEVES